MTDDQRALKAGVGDLQAVSRRVLARARRQARVPGGLRQRAHAQRLPRRADSPGIRRRRPRDRRRLADPPDHPRERRQRRRVPRADVHHGHAPPARQRSAEEAVPAENRDGRPAPAGVRGDRAERGLGHDDAADHGDPARRPLRRERPEDVHLARDAVRPDAAARPHDAAGSGQEARRRPVRVPLRHPQAPGLRDPAAPHDDEPLDERALLRQRRDPRRQPHRRGGQGLPLHPRRHERRADPRRRRSRSATATGSSRRPWRTRTSA